MASSRLKRLFSAGGPSQQQHEEYAENEDEHWHDQPESQSPSLVLQHTPQVYVPPRELLATLANTVADPSITTGIHRAACLYRGGVVFSAFLACVRLEQKLDDADVSRTRMLFSSIARKASDPLDDGTSTSAILTSFKSKAKSRMTTGFGDVNVASEREESRRMHIARQAAAAAALEALPVYDGAVSDRLPPCLKPLRDLLVDLLSACNDDVGGASSSTFAGDASVDRSINDSAGALVYVPALIGMLCAGVVLYSRQTFGGSDKARRRKEARVSLALALLGAILGFFPFPSVEQEFGCGLASVLISTVAPTHVSYLSTKPRSPSVSTGSTSTKSESNGSTVEGHSPRESASPPTQLSPVLAESLQTFGCISIPADVDLEVAVRRFAHSLLLDRRKAYSDAGRIVYAAVDTL